MKIRVVRFCTLPLVAPSQKSTYFDPSNGVVMMVPENLVAFVDEVKMTGQLETPREGLINIAATFPSVMKARLSIQ
jgi:hypothetical protein